MPAVIALLRGHLIDGHVHTEVPNVADDDDSIAVSWICGVLLLEKSYGVPVWRKDWIGAASLEAFDAYNLMPWF